MRLELDVRENLEELSALEPEWRALWQADASATPFQSPEWLLPWTRHLWGGGRVCGLAMRHDGTLAAFAPLFFWGYGGSPQVIRVSFLGAGITDYLGILAIGEAGPAARLLFDWLAHKREPWDLCEFEEQRADSPLLHAEMPPTVDARREECSVCPVADAPAAMPEFESRLGAAFRHNLHTAENRLYKDCSPEFVDGPCEELLSALFRLHEARWRERHEAGMLSTRRLIDFHCEAARAMARSGMLRLHGLRVNGEIVAVQYNLAAGRTRYLYLSGFNPEFGRYSPGMLLLRESIRHAIAEGAREIDFLRHGEPFKYRWGARDRPNYRLTLTLR